MLRPDTFALTALLALLTAIGPLSIDLYLPSLPEIGQVLVAPTAQVQLTISAYLIGFAGGQIVYGPVSDIYGRKPVLLIALVIYCIATLGCAFAPSIETLIVARAVQAVGASGAIVLARAVVRDLYSGARAGRELSIMGMIMGLAPVIAPSIGSVLQTAFGWRSCFLFVCAAGMVAVAVVWRLLPETLRQGPRATFSMAELFRAYGLVFRNRGFRAYLVLVSASFAGLFAFISGSPFVLQNFLGLTPIEFGFVFAATGAGFIAGNWLGSLLVMRLGLDRTLGLGAAALCLGGLASLLTAAVVPTSVAGLIAPMALYLLGLGLVMPQALAGAMQPFPRHAGTASSLLGFAQQTTAAVAGAVVGHMLVSTAWPLVAIVASMGCVTLVVWVLTRAIRKAPPQPLD